MKKPKHIISSAQPFEAVRLRCKQGTAVITITAGDFEKIWKLAREAIHFNNATRTGTFE